MTSKTSSNYCSQGTHNSSRQPPKKPSLPCSHTNSANHASATQIASGISLPYTIAATTTSPQNMAKISNPPHRVKALMSLLVSTTHHRNSKVSAKSHDNSTSCHCQGQSTTPLPRSQRTLAHESHFLWRIDKAVYCPISRDSACLFSWKQRMVRTQAAHTITASTFQCEFLVQQCTRKSP